MWNWREPSHFVSHSDQVQGDDSEGLKAVRMDPRHQDLLKNVDAPQQPPPFFDGEGSATAHKEGAARSKASGDPNGRRAQRGTESWRIRDKDAFSS